MLCMECAVLKYRDGLCPRCGEVYPEGLMAGDGLCETCSYRE